MNDALAKHRRGLFVAGLLLADALIILLAFLLAHGVRFHAMAVAEDALHVDHGILLQAALMAVVTLIPALWVVGLYEIRRGWSGLELAFGVLIASLLGTMAFLSLSYLLKEFWYSRLMVWIFGGLAWGGLVALRAIVKRVLLWCFNHGIGVLRVVIVGDSPVARSLVAKIRRNSHSGLRVVGRLVASASGERGNGGPAGGLEAAFEALQWARPHVCFFAETVHGRQEMTSLLARCQEEGIRVWLGTELHQRYSPRMELREIESIPVFLVGSLRLATWERVLKRSMDVAGATVLLILASPFLLYAALRVRREIGGPVFYRSTRVGFQGRPFTLYKLRAAAGGRAGGTPFCDFLRAYSLDEIPQLWNVLRGEMSLVGPRPETPERVRRYNSWNRRRLQVKPGITGMAQVAGVRGEHDFDTKSRFDVRYLENQSILLDLQILLRTVRVVRRRRFGPAPAARTEAPDAGPAGPEGLPPPVHAVAEADAAAQVTGTLPRVGRYRPPAAGRSAGGAGEDQMPC